MLQPGLKLLLKNRANHLGETSVVFNISMTDCYTGAGLFVDTLAEYGVKHVFGNPGTTELPVLKALAERETDTEYVLGLHEDIAVGMASGYASTRRYHSHHHPGINPTGVVNLHITPGLAHGIGNLYAAKWAGTPLVVTAGNHERDFRHEEPLLTGNLERMVDQFCKYSDEVLSVDALPTMLRRAFRVALTPPTGPVFLGLPIDVVMDETSPEEIEPLGQIPNAGRGDPVQVERAADLVGVVNWQSLSGVDAAVLVAAGTFLPDPLVVLVFVGPVVGGFTSLSTTYTGFSRTLMRAARDETLPRRLASIHPEFSTPHVALIALGIPPLVVAPVRPSPVILSIWIALAVLTAGTLRAVALWRLPAVYPDRYAEAPVTLPRGMLKTVAVLGALASLLLMSVVATQLPQLLGVFVVYMVLGYSVYRLRVRQLAARGTDLRTRLRQLADHE